MAEPRDRRVADSIDIQIQSAAYSKDLLTSFSSNLHSKARFENGEEEEEVELTLGLSLNGRFGTDPRAPKLARSSSIPEYMNMNPSAPRDTAAAAAARQAFPGCGGGSLTRTSSLPVEPEEEVRKRKEMQSLRRMEAKRKRTEKQRNMMSLRAARERECGRGQGSVTPAPIPRTGAKGLGGSEKLRVRSKGSTAVSPSQGSGSESESQVIEGTGKSGGEARSLEPRTRTSSDQMESEPNKEVGAGLVRCPSLGTSGMKNQFSNLTVSDNGSTTRESSARNATMLDMPCVSTHGPEGRRVEGFLYRYSKSEEVRIVCVCHGSFLSPAEFVKHAGGTDVEQPLKHITVTSSAAFL